MKVLDEFFETCPECSLPSIVSKEAIKLIHVDHQARLRDMMDQSYTIYACTCAYYLGLT